MSKQISFLNLQKRLQNFRNYAIVQYVSQQELFHRHNTGWPQSHAPMLHCKTLCYNVNIGAWLCGHPVYKDRSKILQVGASLMSKTVQISIYMEVCKTEWYKR